MSSLKGLSDHELVSQLRNLVKEEHRITIHVLAHLAEVRRRELYLGRAYDSLYEYCRGELGYTDASAWRRANAAESIVKCPEALGLLKAGRVNLSTLAVVSRLITPEILWNICDKSKAEVELLVAAWDPKRAAPDRTRPVMVPRLTGDWGGTAPSGGRRSLISADARQARSGGEPFAHTPDAYPISPGLRSEVTGPESKPTPLLRSEAQLQKHTKSEVPRSGILFGETLEFEQKWKVEGVVSKAVKEKLDKCKSLLSGKYPGGVDYDTLLDELTERFLDREDPNRRAQRRKQREQKQKAQRSTKVTKNANDSHETKQRVRPRTRHISACIKEKVWAKDEGRCAYVGEDGRRCNSTHNLQYDHYPVPFARGGANTTDNLRLLCARHNRYSAEKIYGKTHMEKHYRRRIE